MSYLKKLNEDDNSLYICNSGLKKLSMEEFIGRYRPGESEEVRMRTSLDTSPPRGPAASRQVPASRYQSTA